MPEIEGKPLEKSRGFSDRVVLAADHLGRWPLRGVIHDFALFSGTVPAAFVRGGVFASSRDRFGYSVETRRGDAAAAPWILR